MHNVDKKQARKSNNSSDMQSVRGRAAQDYWDGKIDAEKYYDTIVKNSPDYRKLAAELTERKLDAQSGNKLASFARKFLS